MLPLLHRARSGYTGLMAKASVPKGVINFDDINGGKGVSQSVLYSHGWEFARWTKDEGLIGVVRYSTSFLTLETHYADLSPPDFKPRKPSVALPAICELS
jgi:hypothetical protein